MRTSRIAAAAAVTAVALAAAAIPAAAVGGAHASSVHVVTLKEIRFHPGTLTIRRGDSVKWVWRDEVDHNVTFHGFHSATQLSGTYTVRFTHQGTFSYRCTIHVAQGMTGRIIVH